ncbi:hypothetical protein PsYK624_043410 [Phanerochaete sordida]|uniref:Uncharacterized protein n=1 Tax=Phanerochaete sordida TaxID=48140 RepID=A0A9P3LBN1_9APHY|nr:hypothetical protein PsYK624_043410 [Phanerochaete sordida]
MPRSLSTDRSRGTERILGFHSHEHGNGRDVSAAKDDICVKSEHHRFNRPRIESNDTARKFDHLLHKGPEEGVGIMWFFGAGNDTDANNILSMKSLLGGKVVVVEHEGPACLVPSLEWRESVCREPQGDVAFVREERVVLSLVVDEDKRVPKSAVMMAIKNVFHLAWAVTPTRQSDPRDTLVAIEGDEPRDKGHNGHSNRLS